MRIQERTIRKMVNMLNNPDVDGGGIWLPSIQRTFVWNVDQICNLFDSILRNYPISIILLWQTESNVRHRKFIDSFRKDYHLEQYYMQGNKKSKCLVLDGQQRLQSLYIGLKGFYEEKELYFDLYSGDNSNTEGMRYKFSFMKEEKASFPLIKFKDLVWEDSDSYEVAQKIIESENVPDDKKKIVEKNVAHILYIFSLLPVIPYHELDSIEHPKLYTENEVVEVFIRSNSGGTTLSKSDLLLSLLNTSWEKADIYIENLLDKINKNGFKFTKDFVLKLCLTLLNHGAKYEVSKYRKKGIMDDIEINWTKISDALCEVLDFVLGNTYIKSHKAMISYLALIPLVYAKYHYGNSWKQSSNKGNYLIRTLMCGAFSGTPDNLIDKIVDSINENKGFDEGKIFKVIRDNGRSLEITSDRLLLNCNYGSRLIHLLFNLWYEKSNFEPLYWNNTLEIDHIFPRSQLKLMGIDSDVSEEKQGRKYADNEIDQLANCMLLPKVENGPSEKSDLLPEEWFKDKSDDFFKLHLIPRDPELWKMEKFDEFVEARKLLILDKFGELLSTKYENSEVENTNMSLSRYQPIDNCEWGQWNFTTYESSSSFKKFPGVFIFSQLIDDHYVPIFIGQSTKVGRRISIIKSDAKNIIRNSQYIHVLAVKNKKERNEITISLKDMYRPESNLGKL